MMNDPRMTAYALNELDENEKLQLLDDLKKEGVSEEEIAAEVEIIQHTANSITEEFKKDQALRLSPSQREEIFPKESFWKRIFSKKGISIAITASFIGTLAYIQLVPTIKNELAGVVDQTFTKSNSEIAKDQSSLGVQAPIAKQAKEKTIVYKKPKKVINESQLASPEKKISMNFGRSSGIGKGGGAPSARARYEGEAADMAYEPSVAHIPPRQVMPEAKPEQFNREAYDKIEVNPYTLVENQPLSTFSVDVDTASYANMRRFLERGSLPPKDSIRVEEIINYFNYNYDLSHKEHPLAIKVDQSISPWNKDRKLVRVALKADTPSDLVNAKKNLVFLLDVSGSMNDANKLPLLKESMKLLIKKLKNDDSISIVVYAGASGVVLEPTPISESLKILNALENLSAGGSTNAGAGIEAAYKMAKQNFIKGGVNRVILATDGDFNVGTTSQSSLIDIVAEKAKDDIFLTVVGLGMGNYQDSMLENLSNKGNGNYAYIDSLAEANKLFNVDLEKNLTTVAKDVKIQVEFNPSKVKAYRLIGYENRKLAAQDFNDDKKDAGEMGAGHTVTALYEIVPAGGEIDVPKVDELKYAKKVKAAKSETDELLTVKVRYKKPTETTSTKFDVVLKDGNNEFKAMDSEFRFATAAASFAMKLRGDDLIGDLSYRELQKMASDAKGSDPYGFREEMIKLIDLSRQIDK